MRKFKTFWEKSMLEEKIELVYMSLVCLITIFIPSYLLIRKKNMFTSPYSFLVFDVFACRFEPTKADNIHTAVKNLFFLIYFLFLSKLIFNCNIFMCINCNINFKKSKLTKNKI